MKHIASLALVLAGWALAPAAERDADWVRRRVAAIRGSDTEAWRRIPWTATVAVAVQLARHEGRPMFLFSHDGNIDTGRC
jgi:hypothetical protein